jgi:serine/threonine protein kinase
MIRLWRFCDSTLEKTRVAYPTLEQYNQAFSAHSKLLADPELRAGTLAKSGLGLPLAISGGFALTYTVSTSRGKFAVRCFHRESKGLERRYAAISKKLASLRSPYFLDFQFQPQGIRVDGATYPVVKMAWASGSTLGEFLEGNLRNPAALGRLADALARLAAYLQKEGIAHGDIQSGNLMVGRDGSSVQLIDYDGMFVDEIKDLGSSELGHVNFQHPQRKSLNPFDASLDRFSLIALSVSIRALQLDATLWNKTNSEADAILFRANDFLDPANSSAFALLAKDRNLATYVKNFAAVCKSPMARAPNLADFLAGRNIPAITIVISPPKPAAGPITISGRQGYVGAYPVLAATDYAACLRAVGDKVEVIGRIVEVKQDRTQGGKPYIFINFGPWQGSIFKVSIWSDGLSHVKSKPDASWVGKWVSVVGLMEPPFVNKKYRYSHLSITVGAAGTMALINEQEAQWRLAGAGKSAGAFAAATTSNQQTLGRIRGVSGAAPSPLPNAASQAPSSNAQVLQKIRASSQSTAAASSSSSTGRYTHQQPPSSTGRHTYQPPPHQPGVVERFFKWLFG